MNADKTWLLVAPDWEALDTIWQQPLPFVLWPVCGKPLLAFWLDEALRAGAETITVLAHDRPHLVRAWLEKGDYWSREIKVITQDNGLSVDERRSMDRLPGSEVGGEVTDGRDLLERWFSLHAPALRLRESAELVIDREISPGVWLGPGAVVHPSAELKAPCWIGPRARVGARCRLGPNAYIANRAVVDDDVEASDAVVCADTFVGRHTHLQQSAAQGGLLLNWRMGVAVRIAEEFILSDLTRKNDRPAWGEQLLALAVLIWAWPAGWLLNLGRHPSVRSMRDAQGASRTLKTWPNGPLIFRRAGWLGEVAAGRLKWFGILPRSGDDWERVPEGLRSLLEKSTPGLLALSDLYNCHDPAEPDEWMHAAYQAGAPDQDSQPDACRIAWQIAWKTPIL